jgi:hypothetical protein
VIKTTKKFTTVEQVGRKLAGVITLIKLRITKIKKINENEGKRIIFFII